MSSRKNKIPTNFFLPQDFYGTGGWNGAPQLHLDPLPRSTPSGPPQHTSFDVPTFDDLHGAYRAEHTPSSYYGTLNTANRAVAVPYQRTPPGLAVYTSTLTTSPVELSLPSHEETELWLRNHLKIPAPCPLNLWCLRDITSVKKLPNLTEMIMLAIWGSPYKRLGLSEIYIAIEDRYPVLKTHRDKPWQRSIRHRLSLKSCFVRARRERRGADWVIDVSKGLENSRGYKAPPPQNTSGSSSDSHSQSGENDTSAFLGYSSDSDAFLTPPPEISSAVQEYTFMSSGTSIDDLAEHNMAVNYGHIPY